MAYTLLGHCNEGEHDKDALFVLFNHQHGPRLSHQTPPGIAAWALDTEHPAVAIALYAAMPSIVRPVVETPRAVWHAPQSREASPHGEGWLATLPRLYQGVYALLGEDDYAGVPGYGGLAQLPVREVGTYVAAIGTVLGTIHYHYACSALGFSVVLAREYPAEERPLRLYVQLDPAQARTVQLQRADPDVRDMLAWSLARLSYVPTRERQPRLFAAFERCYIAAARAAGHAGLAQDVLDEMQNYV